MDINLPPGVEELFSPEYRYKVLAGGRGSTKSTSVATALLAEGLQEEPLRILCAREYQKSISESVHQLLKEQIRVMGLQDIYHVQRDRIFTDHGTEFIYRGLRSDPAGLQSMHGIKKVWLEEAQTISEESWRSLDPTIRAPGSQIYIVYNPRYQSDFIHKTFAIDAPPPRTWYKRLNWRDNPWFPEELDVQRRHMLETNPLMYRHVWEGECVPSLTFALFGWDDIANNRWAPGSHPDFHRVLVGVDPAVTAHKKSDETGIVVAGATNGKPRHYGVLADLSGRMSPEAWARKALAAYDEFEADGIVAETNQGGDMVKQTIEGVCKALGRPVPRLILVRASRGKAVRAEPIAALYTQGLVHHVGTFGRLEEQMCLFEPTNPNAESPDRMDALVWVLTELSTGRAPMRLAPSVVELLTGAGRRR